MYSSSTFNLQKRDVCTQLFVPAKFFKICHIYRKRKCTHILSNFEFPFINALVYVEVDQSIYKMKKSMWVSFSINMANFETFCQNKKLSAKLLFLKSALLSNLGRWLWYVMFSRLLQGFYCSVSACYYLQLQLDYITVYK